MSFETPEQEERFQNLLLKGTRLLRQGKAMKAMPYLEEAYELAPQDFDVALNLGGALVMGARFSKAIPILERLRAKEPNNAMVWTNLGAAYLGNPILASDEAQEMAIEAFKKALVLDARAPSVAYNLGLIYRDRKELDEAILWLRKAVDTNPSDRHARMLLKKLRNEEKASGR